mgnify:CR=1 FL=1
MTTQLSCLYSVKRRKENGRVRPNVHKPIEYEPIEIQHKYKIKLDVFGNEYTDNTYRNDDKLRRLFIESLIV